MLRAAVRLVLALAAASACDGRGDAGGRGERAVPFTEIEGPGAACRGRRMAVVARGQEEWRQLWDACGATAPAVDLTGRMAIVYASGWAGGGFSMQLEGVTENAAGDLVVHLATTSPRAGCTEPASVVYPRVAVLVPARDAPIRIVRRHRRTRC